MYYARVYVCVYVHVCMVVEVSVLNIYWKVLPTYLSTYLPAYLNVCLPFSLWLSVRPCAPPSLYVCVSFSFVCLSNVAEIKIPYNHLIYYSRKHQIR